MPAIRVHYNCVLVRLDHRPATCSVPVKTRSGEPVQLRWLGFVYQPLLELTEGLGYAKVLVHDVTPDSGLAGTLWRQAQAGEYLLGWRCEYEATRGTYAQGVFGVVDAKGWPVLVGGRPALRLVG